MTGVFYLLGVETMKGVNFKHGYRVGPNGKTIVLTKGKVALVDDEDFAWLNLFSWHAFDAKSSFYAARGVYRGGKHLSILMHRVIMNTPDGKQTDHINGDGLDNRKQNLRICTSMDNMRNREKFGGLGYKGVSFVGWRGKVFYGTFRARIHVNRHEIHLGVFETDIDAAQAYDEAAKKYFGEFARLNFPTGKSFTELI